MFVVNAKNVHEAFQTGMLLLSVEGIKRNSRAGEVLVSPEPVATVYENPTERVLFWESRDANPFFHFMEGLWMIAGRNDVKWISQFNSTIHQFSDNEVDFHGAYGHRWVKHFLKFAESDEEYSTHGMVKHFNQLQKVVEMLKKNPDERRCVVQMWDASVDLGRVGKDVPCNTQIYFKIDLDGRLNMTVCNRSNDIIWGAYGANAVHMSMLQEYMASAVGVPVGKYWQISNDYHAYVNIFDKHKEVINEELIDPYETEVSPYPMVSTPIENWLSDLEMFMSEGPAIGLRDPFFRKVAVPMWKSWFAFKNKEDPDRIDHALTEIESCIASDWKLACTQWLIRKGEVE